MKPYKIADYQRRLLYNKKDNIRMVTDILKNGSYEDIMDYYVHTPNTFKGLYKFSIKHLIRKSYEDIYFTGGVYLKEPEDYVGLMAFVLPLFKDQVNEFLKYKRNFDHSFLEGRYDDCNEALSYIEANVSYSAWGATNRIRIAELRDGAESRTKVFNDICNSCKSAILTEICACARDAASIDASTSAWYEEKYKNDVMAYSHEPWQKNFIVSHLHPYKSYDRGRWMSFDMLSSIIDLYVNFIYNMRFVVPLCKYDMKIVGYLTLINNVIDDNYLDKYCSLIGIKSKFDWTERDLLLNDLYTKQPADIDKETAEDYIANNPCDVDYLFEYIKVLVDSKQVTSYGKADGCVLDRVKFHLFSYLMRKEPVIHLNKLKIICQSNPTLMAFRQTFLILKNLEFGKVEDFALSYWCYSYGYNLLDGCFFISDDMRDKMMSTHWKKLDFTNDGPNSIRMAIYMYALKRTNSELSKLHLENYVYQNEIPPYFLGMVVSYLISEYLKIKDYSKVVSLYVDCMLEHPLLNLSVDKDKIFQVFTRDVDLNIDNPLNLSIFYTMLDAKPGKIQANAYRYVTSQGVDRPSKLNIDRANKKVIYYLAKVVDRNILDLFPLVFKEPTDTIEERFKICQKLKEICQNRKFNSEMNELVKELGTMKMLKEVDASKIDVDEDMLKKHEMKQGQELFNLYKDANKDIETFADEGVIGDFFPKDEDNDNINHKTKQKVVPYKYLLFVRFYLFVRDQFLLNNKAGLDYYMSSRIRHGTIVNQLRHHIQELKLTTRKNDVGRYDLDTYWANDVFKLNGPEYVQCQEAFLRFTNQIDLIISRLKNERVQIKTENFNPEKDACFDFSRKHFTQRMKSLYDEKIEDYYNCIDAIFNDMWDRAEECFVIMKSGLQQADIEIKNTLENLKNDVHDIIRVDNQGLSIFNDTITRSQTYLHDDINAISGWFQRKKSTGYDFYLQQLIDASMEAVNKINTIQIECKSQIESKSVLASRFLNVFYDLFYNLFTNVIDHAEIINGKAKCNLTVIEYGEDMLKISVSNVIAEKEKEMASVRIKEYEFFLANRDNSEKASSSRTEGKSGIYKIDTIVYFQLKAEGNTYSPRIEGDRYVVDVCVNLHSMRVENENIVN